MLFEPKELHECSPPWISTSNRAIGAIVIGFTLLLLVILAFYKTIQEGYDGDMYWATSALICAPFMVVFLGLGLYFVTDKKDDWLLVLPYNRLLFNELHKESKAMLIREDYLYEKNKDFNVHDYERNKQEKKVYARSYKIITRGTSSIVYEYGLIWLPDNKPMSKLHIKIRNVRMGNLRFAKYFLKDVMNVLGTIEYEKFEHFRKD